VPAVTALMLATASVAQHATAANPRGGAGNGVSTVVSDGGEPSVLLPLLVLAGIVVIAAAAIEWWRHFGGWSSPEMTVALQVTGRDVAALGRAIERAGRPVGRVSDVADHRFAAVAAHQRAAGALATVLRRRDLGAVQEALAEAERHLELMAYSQNLPVEPTRDHVAKAPT
jgi:hypothetical protein